MIALVVMTDGRDTIEEAIPSALANLHGPITSLIIHDDTGDPLRFAWLQRKYAGLCPRLWGSSHRQGFGAAIGNVWYWLNQAFDEQFVFWLEDDFVFNRPVDLTAMIEVLTENPNLVQLALRRQPWNAEERAAGGIVEQHPNDYTDRSDRHGNEWLEHRRFFTTNPSLYRRQLCGRGWPQVEHSEGVFTHQLLEDPDLRFGFWGPRHSAPWVHHIGNERVGCGY